jgi:hypothetical protein
LQATGETGITLDQLTVFLILFADDLVLMSETEKGLQTLLNALHGYCEKWNLVVNVAKTKMIVFRKGGFLRKSEVWCYNNERIDVVDIFVYLGLLFVSNGKFLKTTQLLAEKGLKAANVLMSQGRELAMKPLAVMGLFDVCVAPVVNYAAEVWGFHKAETVERVHRKCCKQLLKVKQSTCNSAVYGELGRLPLACARIVKIVKYWFKVRDSENVILKTIYDEMVENGENHGHTNWVTMLRDVLNRYGFSEVWLYADCVDAPSFMKVFEQRVKDMYITDWFKDIQNSSKLNLYKYVKSCFDVETYLDVVLNQKHRKALTQLRVSSHSLHIETGRYGSGRVERERRVCRVCDCGEIEDEYHFLLICPVYENLRSQLIKSYYTTRPSMFKCVELLTGCNKSQLRKLAKYIFQAFELRKLRITV